MKHILITGATGFLGSHMRVSLLEKGYYTVGIDTCERSNEETIERIADITGVKPLFFQCDIADRTRLEKIMNEHDIECVIHFAAYKAVGESCEKPGMYIENNIAGTIQLLRAMESAKVKNLVFSSSATVYDGTYSAPYAENSPVGSPLNPYGASKYQIEQILDTWCTHSDLSVISLRYFNPVGAHPSGKIGEDIRYSNKSLIAFVMYTLLGDRNEMCVFGGNRDTPDGSCIRDYITVNDLIVGHCVTLEYLFSQKQAIQNEKINLGTGHGVSVIEFLEIVKKATGKPLPYRITDRRPGDIGVVYANADKAFNVLGWKAKQSLEDAIKAQWEFVQILSK